MEGQGVLRSVVGAKGFKTDDLLDLSLGFSLIVSYNNGVNEQSIVLTQQNKAKIHQAGTPRNEFRVGRCS